MIYVCRPSLAWNQELANNSGPGREVLAWPGRAVHPSLNIYCCLLGICQSVGSRHLRSLCNEYSLDWTDLDRLLTDLIRSSRYIPLSSCICSVLLFLNQPSRDLFFSRCSVSAVLNKFKIKDCLNTLIF